MVSKARCLVVSIMDSVQQRDIWAVYCANLVLSLKTMRSEHPPGRPVLGSLPIPNDVNSQQIRVFLIPNDLFPLLIFIEIAVEPKCSTASSRVADTEIQADLWRRSSSSDSTKCPTFIFAAFEQKPWRLVA